MFVLLYTPLSLFSIIVNPFYCCYFNSFWISTMCTSNTNCAFLKSTLKSYNVRTSNFVDRKNGQWTDGQTDGRTDEPEMKCSSSISYIYIKKCLFLLSYCHRYSPLVTDRLISLSSLFLHESIKKTSFLSVKACWEWKKRRKTDRPTDRLTDRQTLL